MNVPFVLPDDEGPAQLPNHFSLLTRRHRTLVGVHELKGPMPENEYQHLQPVSFKQEPATLKDIYLSILQKHSSFEHQRII